MVAPSRVPPSNPFIVVLGITGGFPQSAIRRKQELIHEVNDVKQGSLMTYGAFMWIEIQNNNKNYVF